MQGQVLNLTSAWWMQQACSHVPNALLAVPHPNVALMAKCTGKQPAQRLTSNDAHAASAMTACM